MNTMYGSGSLHSNRIWQNWKDAVRSDRDNQGTASSKLQLNRLHLLRCYDKGRREDFTEVYEIISVVEKVNWQQLLVVSSDTKPKDHKMKRGGSGSWRGDSSSLTLLSIHCRMLWMLEVYLSLVQHRASSQRKIHRGPLNMKTLPLTKEVLDSQIAGRLGEYLGDNQHMPYLSYFYRLTKACRYWVLLGGWTDLVQLFPPHVRPGTD